MNNSKPIIENGIIAGNLYDKYGTKNPIARYLMKRFMQSVDSLVDTTGAKDIHEVGCGDGYLSVNWAKENRVVRASDFSKEIIIKALDNAKKNNVVINFKAASIYDLTLENDSAELIVCCEVLEHLEKPQLALDILAELANPYLIVSVPREPFWSILNIARGKYLTRIGNTPGHIQRWSKAGFLGLLKPCVEIIRVLTPFPWTMVLGRSK